jgi:hypothetical protein
MKISEDEYDLVMQNDSNTGGYTQWFNFMIGNRKRRGTIKLRIINFVDLLGRSISDRRCMGWGWSRWLNLWCSTRIGSGVVTTWSISWTRSRCRVARPSTTRLWVLNTILCFRTTPCNSVPVCPTPTTTWAVSSSSWIVLRYSTPDKVSCESSISGRLLSKR